jgi:prephenate dehydrogenase
MIKHLCIIGVGLIGGSFARAVREQGLCERITGVGRNLENLEKAVELGVIDDFNFDLKSAVKEADFVFISTPVGSYEAIFSELKPVWSDKAVYTDAGSTKQSVVKALVDAFGVVPSNFIPGHPIAGAENSGVLASRVDLYKGKQVILTPTEEADSAAVEKVQSVWQAIGAEVSSMAAEHHDRVLAETSHLPHLLAYTLVDLLGQKDEQREVLKYAAGGFRDFTRIASSDPRMWVDICAANDQEIITLLDQFSAELAKVSGLLKEKKQSELLTLFRRAQQTRQRFLDQSN